MEIAQPSPIPAFEPPGPGTWEMDALHFSKPIFGLLEEVAPRAFDAGMRRAMAEYGMLLETFALEVVNGFPYRQARVVGAPPGGGKLPPRWIFKLVLALHPEIRRRMKSQRDLFERRPWRRTMEDWDGGLKRDTIARHTAVDSVDVSALDDGALAAHVVRLREQAVAMLVQDHGMNLAFMVPVGDFLAQTRAWTGAGFGELMRVFRGHSAISAGDSDERRAVLVALRADAGARALLHADAPAVETYAKLRVWPGAVGETMRAMHVIWGNALCHGITLLAPSVEEEPGCLLGALRACLTGSDAPAEDTAIARSIRDRVPEASRPSFDRLLEDAKLTFRLRDERHLYGVLPCLGMARRALREVGRRLASSGVLPDASFAFVARASEIECLLGGTRREIVAELAERMRLSKALDGYGVPARLGPAPVPPPPIEWLPHEAARRAMRALDAYMRAMDDEETNAVEANVLSGLAVSGGVHEGLARVCASATDLDRIRQGDVLVAAVTTPAINIVLPMLGAIVTDRGGALSHAAIVCREFGIPGVVGTRTATKTIQEGARVRVDGDRGVVTVLS